MSLDQLAFVTGYCVMAILSIFAAFVMAYYLLGEVGAELWKRLSRVYAIATLRYWLRKMEREGRKFPRADE